MNRWSKIKQITECAELELTPQGSKSNSWPYTDTPRVTPCVQTLLELRLGAVISTVCEAMGEDGAF